MNRFQRWKSLARNIGLAGVVALSLSACGDRWKEEVLLHDGSKIVVERSQNYGGRHELGQSSPIKEQELSFSMPVSGKRLSFKSEYGEDIGRANFNLLALHILNGTPYIVTKPNLCLSYNKWGRPNPPYVIFRHDGLAWQRIPLQELPAEFGYCRHTCKNRTWCAKFPCHNLPRYIGNDVSSGSGTASASMM